MLFIEIYAISHEISVILGEMLGRWGRFGDETNISVDMGAVDVRVAHRRMVAKSR